MNYNKFIFTVEEFMALPIHESANLANTGEIFLLQGRMSSQREYLQELIKEHTEAKILEQIKEMTKRMPNKDHRIKVNVWKKHKDGNVTEYGGTISFKEEVPELQVKDDKLVITVGDDSLKFEKSNVTEQPVGTEL